MAVAMNALFVIAEMAPLVKVGGLGDVGGSLPRALRQLGLDVRVALPCYAAIDREAFTFERLAVLSGGAALWQTEVRSVPTYLIEHEAAFGREQVYGYEDDVDRFLAFCDALLASAEALREPQGEALGSAEPAEAGWRPDLLHLHDWHTGFIASRLIGTSHPWAALPRIFTMHTLGFVGPFDAAFARRHRLGKEVLKAPPGLDDRLIYSGLAQGILHSDLLTAVSPTYAREILTSEFGGELAPLLQHRADRLTGILNGIDYEQYDPASDPHLAAPFDAEHLERRAENKRALQQRLGLPVDGSVPLLAMISRLFPQKGPDLAAEAVERLLARHQSDDRSLRALRGPPSASGRFQFVLLGQGDEENERRLTRLAARHPEPVAVCIDFDEALGQLIYGGCDLLLMPSRYEPCGLGQLIALRYGAVPVVRRTGGLADTVEDCDATLGRGTGFVFDEATPEALAAAVERALTAYRRPDAWRRLQRRGMAQDFSVGRTAAQYADLYQSTAAGRGGRTR